MIRKTFLMLLTAVCTTIFITGCSPSGKSLQGQLSFEDSLLRMKIGEFV